MIPDLAEGLTPDVARLDIQVATALDTADVRDEAEACAGQAPSTERVHHTVRVGRFRYTCSLVSLQEHPHVVGCVGWLEEQAIAHFRLLVADPVEDRLVFLWREFH